MAVNMLIPQESLRIIASKRGLSNKEIEVLSLAMDGKPIAEIADMLTITPEAVRKRLANIYETFNITGSGTGKLPKLQQIILSESAKYQPAKESQVSKSKVWELKLNANLGDIDNQKLQTILKTLQELGEGSIILKKIESGSVVLVLESSPELFQRIMNLYQSGQLTALEGIAILDVGVLRVNLTNWLQDNFIEAIQAGWQTFEDIFGRDMIPNPRFMPVIRAKHISLGSHSTFFLVISVVKPENQIIIGVRLYPEIDRTYLPMNLTLSLLDEDQTIISSTQIETTDTSSITSELICNLGDRFSVKAELDNVNFMQYFDV